ncbi:hypothetical protein B0H16DRAFT_1743972 [Mycena metata]|uniref:DUF7730 domain-containing protein n=1 Tax=Mycena metata TaxID=1033252 RepID=A0AAD7MED7_9AGAR|nr:hypothetical protein B0H16DRAFT_1743972 [Mycena metata]
MATLLEYAGLILILPVYILCACISPRLFQQDYQAPTRKPDRTRQADADTPGPTPRIEIGLQPLAEQPESSLFFQLPLELRRNIYRHALGGRVVRLTLEQIDLSPSGYHTGYHIVTVINSAYYEPVDDPDTTPNHLDVPADAIPTALLLSCHQVYLEALPILHRCNTFHIAIPQFERVVTTAFRREILPDIRSIYLCHTPHVPLWYDLPPYQFFSPWWNHVFALLNAMSLESLIFELEADRLLKHPSASNPHGVALDSVWGRGLLSLRGLRHFAIFTPRGLEPDTTGPHPPGFNDTLRERIQALIIGPDSHEFYKAFLAMSRRRGIKDMAAAMESASSGYQPWV